MTLSELRQQGYRDSLVRDREDLKALVGMMKGEMPSLDRAKVIVRFVIRTQRIIDTKESLV